MCLRTPHLCVILRFCFSRTACPQMRRSCVKQQREEEEARLPCCRLPLCTRRRAPLRSVGARACCLMCSSSVRANFYSVPTAFMKQIFVRARTRLSEKRETNTGISRETNTFKGNKKVQKETLIHSRYVCQFVMLLQEKKT